MLTVSYTNSYLRCHLSILTVKYAQSHLHILTNTVIIFLNKNLECC